MDIYMIKAYIYTKKYYSAVNKENKIRQGEMTQKVVEDPSSISINVHKQHRHTHAHNYKLQDKYLKTKI